MNFGRSDAWNIPFAKVTDLVSLGALFGAGAPDPDLAQLGFNIALAEEHLDLL